MNMTLRPIDKINWQKAIQLKVREDQQAFIASNLYSIAEVQFLDSFFAKGIYIEEEMVGFCMYGVDPDDGNYWIYRLMVDEAYQGQGFGQTAIQLIIADIRKRNVNNIPLILIGYHQSNQAAKHAYAKAGFVETNIAPWEEQLAKYDLKGETP